MPDSCPAPSRLTSPISTWRSALQPKLTEQDVSYVRRTFQVQSELERARARDGIAPKPAYLLPDGTPMVCASPDEQLAGVADVEQLRRCFTERWQDAGGRLEEALQAVGLGA
jgi:hypothetical protein